MSNRILKDSICMSAEIDALTWFEEVLFYRLIVTVDDYGIYPAEPVVLAHILFPRKENVSRKMVEEALKHMEKLRLIRRWKGDRNCEWRTDRWLEAGLASLPGFVAMEDTIDTSGLCAEQVAEIILQQ